MNSLLSGSFKRLLVYIWPELSLYLFARNTFVIFYEIMNDVVSTQVALTQSSTLYMI